MTSRITKTTLLARQSLRDLFRGIRDPGRPGVPGGAISPKQLWAALSITTLATAAMCLVTERPERPSAVPAQPQLAQEGPLEPILEVHSYIEEAHGAAEKLLEATQAAPLKAPL